MQVEVQTLEGIDIFVIVGLLDASVKEWVTVVLHFIVDSDKLPLLSQYSLFL
ncbi:MAG: hypothetical protein ABF649_03315 [Bacillus sp. (in: firmicutes)]